jgi:hypothetical protein
VSDKGQGIGGHGVLPEMCFSGGCFQPPAAANCCRYTGLRLLSIVRIFLQMLEQVC